MSSCSHSPICPTSPPFDPPFFSYAVSGLQSSSAVPAFESPTHLGLVQRPFHQRRAIEIAPALRGSLRAGWKSGYLPPRLRLAWWDSFHSRDPPTVGIAPLLISSRDPDCLILINLSRPSFFGTNSFLWTVGLPRLTPPLPLRFQFASFHHS